MASTIDPAIKLQASTEMLDFIEEVVKTNADENIPQSFLVDKIEHLSLDDLEWLRNFMKKNNHLMDLQSSKAKHFHSLVGTCKMVLPSPEFPPRSAELEARIQRLKREQEEREYRNITKNVNGRLNFTDEPPLSVQMRELNNQILMVFQFVVSVITAFVFGYMAPFFLYGTSNAGPRILIGICFAFAVGIADLYFVLKYLLETEGVIKRPEMKQNETSKSKED